MTNVLDPNPTEHEIESAAQRRETADASRREMQLAIKACGPDAKSYGRWTLTDKLGVEPDRIVYCCRREGVQGWQPPAPHDETRLEDNPVVLADGRKFYRFRYSVYFQTISVYQPQSAEQLATARVAREEKRIQDERRRLPLLADQIVEPVQVRKRNRRRERRLKAAAVRKVVQDGK